MIPVSIFNKSFSLGFLLTSRGNLRTVSYDMKMLHSLRENNLKFVFFSTV